jgi:hypothetical protein
MPPTETHPPNWPLPARQAEAVGRFVFLTSHRAVPNGQENRTRQEVALLTSRGSVTASDIVASRRTIYTDLDC